MNNLLENENEYLIEAIRNLSKYIKCKYENVDFDEWYKLSLNFKRNKDLTTNITMPEVYLIGEEE